MSLTDHRAVLKHAALAPRTRLDVDKVRARARRLRWRRNGLAALATLLVLGVPTALYVAQPPPVQFTDSPSYGGSWRRVPTSVSGAAGTGVPDVFWTGTEVLTLHGVPASGDLLTGELWNPETGALRRLDSGGLEWRTGHAAVWTGSELIVWGGTNGTGIDQVGGVYSPQTNQWRPIAEGPLPRWSTVAFEIWTGSEMLVWTNSSELPEAGVGAAYNPVSDSWRPLADTPLRARVRPAVASNEQEVLVWGGCDANQPQCDDTLGGDELSDGARYDIAADTWTRMADGPLAPRDRPAAVWTGTEMMLWGGFRSSEVPGVEGAAYDPRTDAWREVSAAPLSERSNHTFLWADSRVLVWGGVSPDGSFLADGAAYDPTSDDWSKLPTAPISGRDRHGSVWTGTGMVVTGGCCPGRGAAEWRP